MGDFVVLSDDGKTLISNFIEIFLKFGLLTLILTLNFTAVSIALMCNKNESFGVKIFAYMHFYLVLFIFL